MLRIDRVTKCFEGDFAALHSVSLEIERGEIVSVVGTSGCGKSTLLRIAAGLDFPTSGQVWVDNEAVHAPMPEIGMVFQEPRLMPWLNVTDNVKFGLEGFPPALRNELAAEAIHKVGLEDFADALPKQLSGGMAQRVAIARALVTRPQILLLDEPFSALDAFTRLKLQDHLLAIWAAARPTMLFVTHDVEEALALSDRIVVMRGNPGRVHRDYVIDLPRPRSRGTADFQAWKALILTDLDLALDS